MKIIVNDKNEILSYCTVGNIHKQNTGLPSYSDFKTLIDDLINNKNVIKSIIETEKMFPSKFESKKFIYDRDNDEILLNNNFVENRMEIENKINSYKQMLNDTDYKAIKYAEGVMTEEEYAETKAQRQEWRKKINELEEMLIKNKNKF